MRISSSWSRMPDTASAVRESFVMLTGRLGGVPDLIIVQATAQYDFASMISILRTLSPDSRIHGSTSSVGVMTEEGFHSRNGQSIGMLGICDQSGSYGVGAVAKTDDARLAASKAVESALIDAGRPGEMPGLVILTASPGNEEGVLQGINDVIGPEVPVVGGTAADNTFEGKWKLFTSASVYCEAVEVTVMFPSVPFGLSLHSGFSPTQVSGRVTRAKNRVIYEIDSRPAAEVYNEWLGGSILHVLAKGGSIYSMATTFPLGRVIGSVGDVPYYLLSHFHSVGSDGSLGLFTDVEVGDEMILMTGNEGSMISKADRVAQAAMDSIHMTSNDISGALLMCCSGYLLADGEMNLAADRIRQTLGEKPFLGTFSFGEQGHFLSGENRHGNLMVSALVFGK